MLREGQLEKIVTSSPILSVIREHNLLGNIPINEEDVTVRYLMAGLDYLETQGVERSQFLDEFEEVFAATGFNGQLQHQMNWVNIWAYRAFMEVSREIIGMESQIFHESVATRSFSDQERDLIIRTAKYFDLGFVLRDLDKKTEEFQRVYGSKCERVGKGHIKQTRATREAHVNDLKKYFGEELTKEILRDDCAFTQAAYRALFAVFKDKDSRIEPHTVCEADDHEHCIYDIYFTPGSKTEVIKQLMLRHVFSYLVPGLKDTIALNDQLRDEVFHIGEIVGDLERDRQEAYAALQISTDAALRTTRHDMVNDAQVIDATTKSSAVKRAELYFGRLMDLSESLPVVGEFLDELQQFGFESVVKKDGRYQRGELDLDVNEIINPNIGTMEDNHQAAREKISQYNVVRDTFISRKDISPALEAVLREDPWDQVELFYAIHQKVSEATRNVSAVNEDIRHKLSQRAVPLTTLVSQAMQHLNNPNLHVATQIQGDPQIPLPTFYRDVLKDLFNNIAKYGGGHATIAAYEDDTDIYVEIRDQGKGMPESDLARINSYLTGESTVVGIATQGTGQGTQDLSRYLQRVRDLRKEVNCTYSYDNGLNVQFRFGK